MSIKPQLRAALALAALSAAPLTAQQHDHAHAGDFGTLGRVEFPISCSAQARPRFEHAMAALHSFWWQAGDSAFGAVLAADPTCAMAHWGIALNAWGNPFAGGPIGDGLEKGARAAERAAQLAAGTPRERGFIAAAGALYRDAQRTPNPARLQAYSDTMARLYRDFPNDREVAIYYSLSLLATAPRTDTTFAVQRKAIGILEPLFAKHPDHPGLAHYVIHATDSPALAKLGVSAARRYARIAPAAPHAQHMPSHIFVRLGLWDETVSSNWKSYEAGMQFVHASRKAGTGPEELHALDYAVYGYLQQGQDSAARAAAEVAAKVPASDQRAIISLYNGMALRARIPLEQGDWAAAAAFPAAEPGTAPVTAALSRFTRAIGAARSGKPDAARTEVAALDSIAAALAAVPDAYWASVVRIKRDAATAWIKLAEGDSAGALALAKSAADEEEGTDKHPITPGELLPARELQGDMLLAVGRHADARAAYLATLKREAGRARSIFGAARAAELAGDQAAAKRGYGEYLRMMKKGDGRRAELAIARGR